MQGLKRWAQRFALGAATGLAISLVLMLVGFTGGPGWNVMRASRALGFFLMPLLVVLAAVIFSIGFGRIFHVKMTVEDYDRRSSYIPFILAMSLTVLAFYLGITPPITP